MSFVILNCLLSIMVAVLIAFSIVWFEHWLTKVERFGLGIVGGSALLRIPVIYYTSLGITTPYDGWATCLYTAGFIIFFSGWMYRKRVHDLANERAVAQARDHHARKRAS